MQVGHNTPALIASGTIRPYRCVTADGTDNSCAESNANEKVLGIADGSNKAFDSANHAESGDVVRLQPGDIKLVEAGGAINAGDKLKPDGDGKAVVIATSGTTIQQVFAVALQDGADTRIIRVEWQPHSERPDTT